MFPSPILGCGLTAKKWAFKHESKFTSRSQSSRPDSLLLCVVPMVRGTTVLTGLNDISVSWSLCTDVVGFTGPGDLLRCVRG